MVSQGAARGQLLHQASTQYLETFSFALNTKSFQEFSRGRPLAWPSWTSAETFAALPALQGMSAYRVTAFSPLLEVRVLEAMAAQ